MYFRMEIRISAADVGSRVVVRWRRPAADGGPDEVADVLGILETADDVSFGVRKASGDVVTIPVARALAAKTVPPPPRRSRPVLPAEGTPQAQPER